MNALLALAALVLWFELCRRIYHRRHAATRFVARERGEVCQVLTRGELERRQSGRRAKARVLTALGLL